MMSTSASVESRLARFDAALEAIESSPEFGKAMRQADLFQAAGELLDTDEGVLALLERAHRFDEAGVFKGGPWEKADALLPRLIGGGLRGEGVHTIVEALSELRLLAGALGRGEVAGMTQEEAASFLREAIVLNLDLYFGVETEESRKRPEVFARAQRLLRTIADQLTLEGIREEVVDEVDFICAQRPIVTARAVRLIKQAVKLPGEETDRFRLYRRAVEGPTELAREHPDFGEYAAALETLSAARLNREVQEFMETLLATGTGSSHHATLLRHVARNATDQIPAALGLDEAGVAELNRNMGLCRELIHAAIFPETAFAIFGLGRLLERGLLSQREVAGGLRRIRRLEIRDDVRGHLEEHVGADSSIKPSGVLLAGAVAVLGQPLGVGQGHNPTCQSARGISLWSQHAPGFLLAVTKTAARDGVVHMMFEGVDVQSDRLAAGLGGDAIDHHLDPLSMVLTPHLDRIYAQMMRLAAARGEDAHKWVNRAMYGRWIPHEFCAVINAMTNTVDDFNVFARTFFATHHPAYNGGREMVYPNPVGIFVTDIHGRLLGAHAVTVLRVGGGRDGEPRVYFFNPNNEGRQQWGNGVSPTVRGHRERPGESSLPFGAFLSRLYAFHFNPNEQGDPTRIPQDEIDTVMRMARDSWGRAYGWTE